MADAIGPPAPAQPLDDDPIDPTDWDLIVLGSGLAECLVASTAARAGRSVLQLDAAPRFGGGWATLNLEELVGWLIGGEGSDGEPAPTSSLDDDDEGGGTPRLIRLPPPRFSALPGASLLLAPGVTLASLGPARGYALDLAPALLYASGPAVAAILAAGAAPYTEFRLAGPGWVWDASAGGLAPVPASRADVFRDGRLGLADKRGVMRFLGAAAAALGAGGGGEAGGPLAAALHSADTPLAAVVAQAGLPQVVADAVLYSLAAADADQGRFAEGEAGDGEGEDAAPPLPPSAVPAPPPWCAAPLSGKDGGRTLSLYLTSMGRYGSTGSGGALLAPVHGAGEVPQAFARASAVAGGAAALRRTVVAVEVEEEKKEEEGRLTATAVRLASGQRLTCRSLAAGEEVVAGADGGSLFPPCSSPSVSRAIVILDGPLVPLNSGDASAAPPPSPDGTTAVLVLPPRCLGPAHPPHAVRGLQVGAPTAACPAGKVVLYLSTPASDPQGPQADLEPALAALARLPGVKRKEAEGATTKPAVLFAAFYREPGPAPPGSASAGLPDNVALLPPPMGALTAAAAAVAAAGAALETLWPGGEVRLFSQDGPGVAEAAGEGERSADPLPPCDESDEEAAATLEAALAALDADG